MQESTYSNTNNNSSGIRALSPLDGRYSIDVEPLVDYFSEASFIQMRLFVELRWFSFLLRLQQSKKINFPAWANADLSPYIQRLNGFFEKNPDPFDLSQNLLNKLVPLVKDKELTLKHDVKAIEYTVRDFLSSHLDFPSFLFVGVHYACTSEDINNVAYGMILNQGLKKVLIPQCEEILSKLKSLGLEHLQTPVLSLTHGQPAAPTTFGKECAVFYRRLKKHLRTMQQVKIPAKFNGSTGNYHSFAFAQPDSDWLTLSQEFVTELGLEFQKCTTQIESHDDLAELLDSLKRWNSVALGLSQDFWLYISRRVLTQNVGKDVIGSSVMPHKVNPINFENAEGNYGISSSLCSHFSDKLLRSRLQRDLSDSTVLRSLGSVVGYHLVAQKALMRGLNSICVDEVFCNSELDEHWEVLTEAIQTLLRQSGDIQAYETIKKISQNQKWDRKAFQDVMFDHNLSEVLGKDILATLGELSPHNFTGLASKIAQEIFNDA